MVMRVQPRVGGHVAKQNNVSLCNRTSLHMSRLGLSVECLNQPERKNRKKKKKKKKKNQF